MRRRRHESDSLDMLLDTVCNVFGGIVFIVMLIAVLAFARAGGDPSLQGRTRAEIQAAFGEAGRIAILSERRDELLAALAQLDPQVDPRDDDDIEGDALDVRRAELLELLAEAESREARLEALRGQMRGDLEAIAEQVDDAAGMTEEIERQIAQLERQIAAARARRTVEARLPIRRTTRRTPIHCVIRGDRMHLIWPVDPQTGETDWSDTEARDVRSEVRIVPAGEEISVRLRADGGFRVDGNLTTHPRWRELMSAANRERAFLSLIVDSDGFEPFLHVKAATLAAGFQYDVLPWDGAEPLVFVPGSDFTSQ